MPQRVLIVEDEQHLAEGLRFNLVAEGYDADVVDTGEAALTRLSDPAASVDLVVLDVMLPSLDGFEVLREIRHDSQTPIVMLTARSELHDVVVGLELGADDYVTKPFELPELVARVKAVLRRAAPAEDVGMISVAGLEIDPDGFTARKRGEELLLTATEFRLLLELARRPKQVFTRELLLELVWNYDYLGDSRLVDAAVQRLRAKVEDDPKQPALIKTVRGVGYRFDAGS